MKDKTRLRWNGNNQAQAEADAAYTNLRNKTPKTKFKKNKQQKPKPFVRPDYNRYINSKKWARMRLKVFKIHGRKCVTCGSTQNIQVHHKHYRTLGRENPRIDLEPLCGDCHGNLHGKDVDILSRQFQDMVANF